VSLRTKSRCSSLFIEQPPRLAGLGASSIRVGHDGRTSTCRDPQPEHFSIRANSGKGMSP
jgi:hypothetical protein